MNDRPSRTDGQDGLPFSQEQEIDRLCSQFEQAWRGGQRPKIDDYLGKVALSLRDLLVKELSATEEDSGARIWLSTPTSEETTLSRFQVAHVFRPQRPWRRSCMRSVRQHS